MNANAKAKAKTGQLAIEFVGATMIFLFVAMLVISALFRGYSQVADASAADTLGVKGERFAEMITGNTENGFAEEDGSLNYTKLASSPANYSALRQAIRFKDDYYFSVSYLPSLILDVFFENPLARTPVSPQQTVSYPFDAFSNRTTIDMQIFARSLSGDGEAAETFVLLINGSDYLIDEKRIAYPETRVSLSPTFEGVYTIKVVSYVGPKSLFGVEDLVVGVLSAP